MAFAKRLAPSPASNNDSGHRRLPSTSTRAPVERYQAFRQTLLSIYAEVVAITDAVKANGTIAMRGFGGVMDPESSPVMIRGIGERFLVHEDGETLHAMFTFVSPDHLDRIDPSAQLQLHELVTGIRDLNTYCQAAERDEALGVALQSPSFPERIDRIVALAAFFAGYFENLAAVGPIPVGLPGKARPGIDLAALGTTLDRHKLMALDRMVEPDSFARHWPAYEWPHLGAELVRRPETGQDVSTGVYLPAQYARQLAAKAKRAAGKAGLAPTA